MLKAHCSSCVTITSFVWLSGDAAHVSSGRSPTVRAIKSRGGYAMLPRTLRVVILRTQHCDLTSKSILVVLPWLGLGLTCIIMERPVFACRRWLPPVVTARENSVLERLP